MNDIIKAAAIEFEHWAIRFHDTYESLAPNYGYETRKDTKSFNSDSANGRLMIEVCSLVISEALAIGREQQRREDEAKAMKFAEWASGAGWYYVTSQKMWFMRSILEDVFRQMKSTSELWAIAEAEGVFTLNKEG